MIKKKVSTFSQTVSQLMCRRHNCCSYASKYGAIRRTCVRLRKCTPSTAECTRYFPTTVQNSALEIPAVRRPNGPCYDTSAVRRWIGNWSSVDKSSHSRWIRN